MTDVSQLYKQLKNSSLVNMIIPHLTALGSYPGIQFYHNFAPDGTCRNISSLVRGDIMVERMFEMEFRRDVSLNVMTKRIIGERVQG